MTDFLPKPSVVKVGGLSRKAQKLQALRDKAAQGENAIKTRPESSIVSMQSTRNSFTGKKTAFQRKAV